MHILISNDDGCSSAGIKALAEALRPLADKVTVVAPDQERSAASNSLTVTQPLRVEQVGERIYAVNGTPTDCVHLAVTGLLKDEPPDMVVSGINHGANLGDDLLYSGTVAAAVEGRFQGFPAVALSNTSTRPQHLDTSAEISRRLVSHLLQNPLPNRMILNINIPDVPLDELGPFECVRLGNRHLAEPVVKDEDPSGLPIYWVGKPGSAADAGEGTDFFAVARKNIAVTPLHIDLTHYQMFNRVRDWVNHLEADD